MATWPEVVQVIRLLGATPTSSPELWFLAIAFEDKGRTQKLSVAYELMPPNMEFVQVRSAFSLLNEIDAADVIRRYGQLLVGSIGFTPLGPEHGPDNGIVSLVSNIPLGCLDLSDPTPFLIYMRIFAGAADHIEKSVSTEQLPDRF